ncbi:MAG: F0F1 ATP synthase subunit epsilon [Flavobacteriaceae bacterium]
MKVEIISPEAELLKTEASSIYVPGINGDFEMLNNHAPIVSLLAKGSVKIKGDIEIDDLYKDQFTKKDGYTILNIESGTIEMSDNKIIILVD